MTIKRIRRDYIFAGDFETSIPKLTRDDFQCDKDFNTYLKETGSRVWLASITTIDEREDNMIFKDTTHTALENFMEWVINVGGVYYFHNLKFDAQFMISYLYKAGYACYAPTEKLTEKSFTILMDDLGAFYSMEIVSEGGIHSKFHDSMKLFNRKLEEAPKAFGFPEYKKEEIDYSGERPYPYIPTPKEIEYIQHDTGILAKMMKVFRAHGFEKDTIASCALANYKEMIGEDNFNKLFIIDSEIDSDIRKWYRGGECYVNLLHQNKEIENVKGYVLDVNSMYPYILREKLLPFGKPLYFEGEYKEDKDYPLYDQHILVSFKMKPNTIPFISEKKSINSSKNTFITDCLAEPIELCLTNIEMKMLLEFADIAYLEYIDGYKYQASTNLFKDYIDKWYKQKVEAKAEGNNALATIAKLMLNSLYGKFGTSPTGFNMKLVMDENGILKGESLGESERALVYLPIAKFTTAYGRELIIRNGIKCFNKLCYIDTDSLHFINLFDEEIKLFDIDEERLGAFKIESNFTRARYLKQKTYIEQYENEKPLIKCAGLSERGKNKVSFEDFKFGLKIKGANLKPVRVKGGIVLKEVDFEIKQ